MKLVFDESGFVMKLVFDDDESGFDEPIFYRCGMLC